MEKDRQVVRPIENTLILCLRATQTEPYLAMCLISETKMDLNIEKTGHQKQKIPKSTLN